MHWLPASCQLGLGCNFPGMRNDSTARQWTHGVVENGVETPAVLLKLTGRLNVVDDPISSEEERPCVDGELE